MLTGWYDRPGGQEAYLRHGPEGAPLILILPPLFEEANRMRQLIVRVMRRLADEGFASALPDLPGTGESLTPIADVRLADWQAATGAAITALKPAAIASFRAGALLDDAPLPRWRCAPETGQRLVRDLKRTQLTGTRDEGAGDHLILAGHCLSRAFIDELGQAALPAASPVRTVRLETDAAAADAKIAGTPLWRRSEPGDEPVLEAAIFSDLLDWARTCAA